jgi:hypothetical protein
MKQTLIAVLVLVVIIALVLLFAGRNDEEETLPTEEIPTVEEGTLPTGDEDMEDDADADTDADASVEGEVEL